MLKNLTATSAAGVFAAAVAAAGMSTAITTDVAAADFSDKRITILVPFNEGGGTDSYTRFMLPYFHKYLPGKPKIIVLNKSGAGGILGGNYFVQKAKTDGTWVFALSTSTISNYTLGDPRVRFKLPEFIPIILSPRGIMFYTRKELGLQNEKTMKAKIEKLRSFTPDQLVFGGKTPTSGGLNLRVAASLLGVEVKSVWGMKGNGPMALAFERGEFTISYDNSISFKNNRKKMIADGIAVPLYTLGVVNEQGDIVRDPTWPNVPNFNEAYTALHGKAPSGVAYEAWLALFQMSVTMSKSWTLPAGTPKDVVEAYRTAARKMMTDPDFMKKRAKIFGEYPQTIGDSAIQIRNAATTISPPARAWLAKYVKARYGVTIGTPKK
jgi:tripartite-type tricarboxylate transporter receptor subunit TctC